MLRILIPGEKNCALNKGINFPDSVRYLNSLSEKDPEDLNFVVGHADIIGYSFVQSAQNRGVLQQELQKC